MTRRLHVDQSFNLDATLNAAQNFRWRRLQGEGYSGVLAGTLFHLQQVRWIVEYRADSADEAWCCTMSGDTLWGVAMPLTEGWKRVVARTERFGVAREVEEALRLLDLSLPVSPADIKRRYRGLAKSYHPDRNPSNPRAAEKMKALNRAFEMLTGVDPNTLGLEESDVTYFARTAPTTWSSWKDSGSR